MFGREKKLSKGLLKWVAKVENLIQEIPRIVTKNDEAKYLILQGDICQYVSSRGKKKIHDYILMIDNELALSRKRRQEVFCNDCAHCEGHRCMHSANVEANIHTGLPSTKDTMEYFRDRTCRGFYHAREKAVKAEHKFPFTIVDQYNTAFVEFPNLKEALETLDKEYTDNYTVVETYTLEQS